MFLISRIPVGLNVPMPVLPVVGKVLVCAMAKVVRQIVNKEKINFFIRKVVF